MAALIAGVFWQAVRLIRECRRTVVPRRNFRDHATGPCRSPRERGLADAFTTYRGGRLAELGDRAAARRGFQRLREHVLRRRALEPAPPPSFPST